MLNKNGRRLGTATAALLCLAVVAGCGTANNATSPAAGSANTTANTTSVAPPPESSGAGTVVATYAGGKLTKQELDQQYNLQIVLTGGQAQETKAQFLSWYVTWFKYVYAKALQQVKSGVNKTQAEQQATQLVAQLATGPLKTTAAVDKKMQSLGVTKDDLVTLLEREQLLQDYLGTIPQLTNAKGTVTAKDEQAYYAKNKTEMVLVTLDTVLLSTKAKAQAVEKQLQAGANVATEADKYSIDPSVKQNHGHFANTIAAQYVPPFAKAAVTLPIGQWGIVQSQYGYHVLRVDKRSPATLAQAKSFIDQQLQPQVTQQAQQEAELTYFNQVKKAASIKVLVPTAQL